MRFVLSIAIVFAILLGGAHSVSAKEMKGVNKGQQVKAVQMQKKVVKKPVPAKKKMAVKKKIVPMKKAKKEVMQGSLSSQSKAVQEEYMRRLRESQKMETSVMYTDSGFSPASMTVKLGAKVKFVNQSSGGMWVASAMHPTHQIYPEFDQKSTGTEYEFEFTKAGSWNYHDHMNPSRYGKVIVE